MGPLELTAADVAAFTGGRLVRGEPESVVGRVVIDSRAVERGDCFIAIKGERFDGHDFLPDVLARGAGAVIVSRDIDPSSGTAPVVETATGSATPGRTTGT